MTSVVGPFSEEIITQPFATREEADAGIATLPEVYRERFPEHWNEHEAAVRNSVGPLQELHRQFVYPEMKIEWNTYNSLIGHPTQHTSACFRCHSGVLRDEVGEPVTLDCTACHFVLADREVSPAILRSLETRRAAPPAVPPDAYPPPAPTGAGE